MKVPARLAPEERKDFLKENRQDVIDGILCRGQKDNKEIFMNALVELITSKSFYMDRASSPEDEIDFSEFMDEVSDLVSEKTFGYNNVEDKSSEFELEEMNKEASKRQLGSSMR
jgi:hypothetical protein